MTNTEKLLICIANAGGSIRCDALEAQTGIPAKNHSGLLASIITKGLVLKAIVKSAQNRDVSEYRIGAAYTPKNSADCMRQIGHTINASEGRPLLRTPQEIEQATAHHQPQPEVGHNTGSAGSVTPPQDAVSAEARAPIEYTAASAQTVQELAQALDKINAQRLQIAALQQKISTMTSMENADPRRMLAELQTYLEESVCIQIGEDYIHVISDGRAYTVDAVDCMEVVGTCVSLEKRLAA